jgi:hypothetical protein
MAKNPPDDDTAPFEGPVDFVRAVDPPPDWERYAILEFVGEGGMGVVYRAIDRQLKRTVALKFLRSRDPEEVARFQREARAQARIDHEHVCRVFDVGEIDGRGFLAMQFINGENLRVAAGKLDLHEKLEVLVQVARAVQAAHSRGVVHRDLKPGNIMVERRSDGRLHATVLDFGIAHGSGDAGDDAPSAPMGTPSFMAPELIRNELGGVDHRVDVYGLGATLYAILAEQAPFFGATRAETKQKVLTETPLRLGLVVPGTSVDLETIVAVAMAKDPSRRYPSARAFADDLDRWLAGEPIRTRRDGPFSRAGAWLRAKRVAAALSVLVALIGLAAVGTALRIRVREHRRQTLIIQHQNEIEQIDGLLRRARMMPLHDTGAAEAAARRRLAEIETSLLEYGPLARGPAYFALGFGHLLLREPKVAEDWLQAAVDSGFVRPEVESALGIAQAMQILAASPPGGPDATRDAAGIAEARRHLERRGPETGDRDLFQNALGLFLAGRLDEALAQARTSSIRVPWLYEGLQLEGDILVARSAEHEARGELDAAAADLVQADDAYARGFAIARSDAWLYEADAACLLRLIELWSPDDPRSDSLFDRVIAAADSARIARPGRVEPLVLAGRVHLLRAERAELDGADPEAELFAARQLAGAAAELDPESVEIADLVHRLDSRHSESGGPDTG